MPWCLYLWTCAARALSSGGAAELAAATTAGGKLAGLQVGMWEFANNLELQHHYFICLKKLSSSICSKPCPAASVFGIRTRGSQAAFLADNRIGLEGIPGVCAALAPAATSLSVLDLSINALGDEGIKVRRQI
jgi:hypothetical protein